MEVTRKRRRRRSPALTTSAFFLTFSIGLFFVTTVSTAKADSQFQKLSTHRNDEFPEADGSGGRGRRFLVGPGSSPPRCTSKCGKCTPCRPVHVTVPPGTPVTAEYYPEAWRCKCGNKLYMP